jgi:putative tryptophan/tyrosine transport system substrate-binding protein
VKRRDFITSVCGTAVAWPLAVRAEQTGKAVLPVLGFLNSASAEGYAPMAAAFRQGLKEIGYLEGSNVVIEYRWAENQYYRLPALAADLVRRRVTAIFANSPSVAAAKALTHTIPIVFLSGDDPVRLGFVASLNRPGGNVTGVNIFSGETATKRLDLLRELVPHASKIAILINTDFTASLRFGDDVEAVAGMLGLTTQRLSANDDHEIERAFNELANARPDALLVGPGPLFDSQRNLLVALAAKIAIPTAHETRATAVAGGLMSYGANVGDGYRQAGIYAGRVLNGEKPASLPVLQSTKFEFIINLKTAKALNLTVPDKLLALADEVIE